MKKLSLLLKNIPENLDEADKFAQIVIKCSDKLKYLKLGVFEYYPNEA